MKKEKNMETNVEQEVAAYFDSENNVEKNESIETLKILDSVGDPTSNDGRRFARQFATERAKTFPLKVSRTSLEDFYNELIGTFPWANLLSKKLLATYVFQVHMAQIQPSYYHHCYWSAI